MSKSETNCTLLVLIALLSATGCARRPEEHLAEGKRLFAEKKYGDAALQFRKAIQGNPRFGEAFLRLGEAQVQLADAAEAYQAFNQAVELMPDNAVAVQQLGDLSLGAFLADKRDPRQLYDKVNSLASRLLARDPKSYDGLRWKGALALLDRKPQDAVRHLSEADRLKPGQQEIVLGLAQAQMQSGDEEKGERALLAFLDAHPDAGPIYDALYLEYVRRKRVADAGKIMTRKAANNPAVARYSLELAEHHARHRDTPAMDAALRSIVERKAQIPDAHLVVGDYYASHRRPADAARHYQLGFEQDSGRRVVYRQRLAGALVDLGKPAEAVDVLDGLLKELPGSIEIRSQRAALLLGAGKAETVVKDYQDLVKAKPNDPALRYNYARALLSTGDTGSAQRELQEAIGRDKSFLPARLTLAQLGLALRNPKETIRYANEVLAIDPTNGAAQLLRAAGLIGTNRLGEARPELERLARALPDSQEVQLQLGVLAIAERNFKQAEEIFSRLRQKDSPDPRAMSGLIETYASRQQFEAALQMVRADLKAAPQSVPMRQLLAQTAARAGEYDVAVAEYRSLLQATPGSFELHMRLGDVLQLKGELAGAVAEFEKAARLNPSSAAPPLFLASTLQQMNRLSEAKTYYRRVNQLQPDNEVVLNNLAFLLAETGEDLDEALRLAQRARQKAPNSHALTDTLGWVYLKKGQLDGAVQVFQSLVREQPDVAAYHYHLAEAFAAKGDKSRARQALDAALTKKPSEAEGSKIKALILRLG